TSNNVTWPAVAEHTYRRKFGDPPGEIALVLRRMLPDGPADQFSDDLPNDDGGDGYVEFTDPEPTGPVTDDTDLDWDEETEEETTDPPEGFTTDELKRFETEWMTPDEQERHERTWITEETIRTHNGHYEIYVPVEQPDGQWEPQWQPMRRWRYTSQPPANLTPHPVITLQDTRRTVVIATNGDAMILEPNDRVMLERTSATSGAAPEYTFHLASNPSGPRYPVDIALVREFDRQHYAGAGRVYIPRRDQNNETVTQLLYTTDNGVVKLGVGDPLPACGLENGGQRIGSGDSAVDIPKRAVEALGMDQPPTRMIMHKGPLFTKDDEGRAKPQRSDARPGTQHDYSELIDHLGQIAEQDPQALVEAFHEPEDGSESEDGPVEICFFVDATPRSIPVDRSLLHDPADPAEPMHVAHADHEAMWAALLQKAYAILRRQIDHHATVSLRPFGPPIDPTTIPIASMPSTTVEAPQDRVSIVDKDGELLTCELGQQIRATDSVNTPGYLTARTQHDPTEHQIDRRLLPPTLKRNSDGEYLWTIYLQDTGLRWMNGDDPKILPAGDSTSLDIDSYGDMVIDENSVTVSTDAMRELGRTIIEPTAPLFATHNGKAQPIPQDIAQGHLGNCGVIALFLGIVHNDPRDIMAMIYEYRRFVAARTFGENDVPIWIRLTRKLWADAHGVPIYAAYDEEHPALWPAFLEKAHSSFESEDRRGYLGTVGDSPSSVVRDFLPSYKLGHFLGVHQPTLTADKPTEELWIHLHPMDPYSSRLDVDTLHELVSAQMGQDADPAFTRRIAELKPKWIEEYADDIDSYKATFFEKFLTAELNEDEKNRWAGEIRATLKYLADADDPDKPFTNAVARRHVADLIRFLRHRGDTIILGTRTFGNDWEDYYKYPGLVGTHWYSLVDVDHRDNGRITLRLANPKGRNPNVPGILEGITHGDGGALEVDIEHITKFNGLVIHGTGIRFALGAPLRARVR
ncbi:MAG: hypothetical protein J2P17_02505, partial [Mycobacterium sp.]|nr:hypothetical protein [Mycobacterium sp.]